ncbi:hypothetical protein GOP47_0009886 [Adiantum capillus-veneris]|uniref:Uncharacterized protein n=1 Tax=Adiantum capillus-veneris TaxID=13818 RepID=A0A9D4UX44_ADICA|nr:hypothetical protein GOP47_0009886 [Adiantum capillus-veneris]
MYTLDSGRPPGLVQQHGIIRQKKPILPLSSDGTLQYPCCLREETLTAPPNAGPEADEAALVVFFLAAPAKPPCLSISAADEDAADLPCHTPHLLAQVRSAPEVGHETHKVPSPAAPEHTEAFPLCAEEATLIATFLAALHDPEDSDIAADPCVDETSVRPLAATHACASEANQESIANENVVLDEEDHDNAAFFLGEVNVSDADMDFLTADLSMAEETDEAAAVHKVFSGEVLPPMHRLPVGTLEAYSEHFTKSKLGLPHLNFAAFMMAQDASDFEYFYIDDGQLVGFRLHEILGLILPRIDTVCFIVANELQQPPEEQTQRANCIHMDFKITTCTRALQLGPAHDDEKNLQIYTDLQQPAVLIENQGLFDMFEAPTHVNLEATTHALTDQRSSASENEPTPTDADVAFCADGIEDSATASKPLLLLIAHVLLNDGLHGSRLRVSVDNQDTDAMNPSPTLMDIIKRVPHPYNLDVSDAYHAVPKCAFCCSCPHQQISTSCRSGRLLSRKPPDPPNDGDSLFFSIPSVLSLTFNFLMELALVDCFLLLMRMMQIRRSCQGRKGGSLAEMIQSQHSLVKPCAFEILETNFKIKPCQ